MQHPGSFCYEEVWEVYAMCICDFTLSEIDNEEMSIQDVIQATVDDFNRTIDYLANHCRTQTYLRHLYDLVVFIQRDDSFCFMDPDRDVFIAVGLSSIGLTMRALVEAVAKTG